MTTCVLTWCRAKGVAEAVSSFYKGEIQDVVKIVLFICWFYLLGIVMLANIKPIQQHLLLSEVGSVWNYHIYCRQDFKSAAVHSHRANVKGANVKKVWCLGLAALELFNGNFDSWAE